MAEVGLEVTVDAFATESNRRARRYWSRYGEPGSEAVDALSVRDWGKSRCPRCGHWHREVVYAFPPSGLIRHVVRKAMVDMAVCALVVPVATTAQHWTKLVRHSLLGGREAPDGYLRIRAPAAQLRHATGFDPKELAIFVCDFAPAGGGGGPDGRLPPACAGRARTSGGRGRCAEARTTLLTGGGCGSSCWRCGAGT